MKVDPDDIVWVVPNDIWMFNRSSPKASPHAWMKALVDSRLDAGKAALALEEEGIIVRLEERVVPTQFRFPSVGMKELVLLRKVKNVVRRGRVSSIANGDTNGPGATLHFGSGQQAFKLSGDHVFVHCTSPGPFNGKHPPEIFATEKELNLFILFAPPVPISMSCLAKLEADLEKGKLDLEFGRKLLVESGAVTGGGKLSGNEVLRRLICGMDDITPDDHRGEVLSLKVFAVYMALLNKDPLESIKWCRRNRLDFLTVPFYKCEVYEYMRKMAADYNGLGFTQVEAKQFSMLADRLKPLEGM